MDSPSLGCPRWLAHELGSADYLLERNPDLVIFHQGSPQLAFRTGEELGKRPEFFERYVRITMVGHDPHTHVASVWVNETSPRLGVVRDDTRAQVPAYLLARGPSSTAELDESGKLVLRMRGADEAWFDVRDIDASAWRLAAIDATSSSIEAKLVPSSRGARIVLASNGPDVVEVTRIELVRAP
jgi:arabinofuranosyltransferase